MIQVITPGSFIRGSHLMRESFVRFSPKRGEIILSPHLLSSLGFKKGGQILFAIDSKMDEIFIALDHTNSGFKVSLDKGRGRIYSVSMFKLIERIIQTTITEPVSVNVEAIPKIQSDVRLFRLATKLLKQEETTSDSPNPITWYKGKAYDTKTWLAKLRAYWERSITSERQLTRDRNKRRYDEMKSHSISHELDIDFVHIEKTPI